MPIKAAFVGDIPAELRSVFETSSTADGSAVTLIDCPSADLQQIRQALESGSPVVLRDASPEVRAAVTELTGIAPSEDSKHLGVRKGAVGYDVLADAPGAASGMMGTEETIPDAEALSEAERVAALAAALQPTPLPRLLKAGEGRYFPGQGATYWTGRERWRREYKIGNTSDVNVAKGYNDSVKEQTLSLDVTADLHVYYSDVTRSYMFVVKYNIISSPGRALVNSGHSRGYFLTKLFADFQLEVSAGAVTALKYAPGNLNATVPFNPAIAFSGHEMILGVDAPGVGRQDVSFVPTDTVNCNIPGWAIKDRSTGSRVSLEMYQKDSWNCTTEPRDQFGKWWNGFFEHRPEDTKKREPRDFVRRMPDTSFTTIQTQVIAAWVVQGTQSSPLPANHDLWFTLRPIERGFCQESAFIHHSSACFDHGIHMFWLDQQIGDAWGLHMSHLRRA